MILTHVEPDQDALHIAYYETGMCMEGTMEVALANPKDASKFQPSDTIRIGDLGFDAFEAPLTITVTHADGTMERVAAHHVIP